MPGAPGRSLEQDGGRAGDHGENVVRRLHGGGDARVAEAGQLARKGPVHGANAVVDHEHLLQRTHKLERYSIPDGLER
jgi:hypothetical protein